MAKRKWQFRTREDAENSARELSQQNGQLSVAINAALHGGIIPVTRRLENTSGEYARFGDENGYYEFGIINRIAGCIVLVTYFCPATGQKPHTAVYWESWVQEEINRFQVAMPNDHADIAYAYREGLYHVRAKVTEHCRTVATGRNQS